MLRTKLSRIIFISGIAICFAIVHFTNTIDDRGLQFRELGRAINRDPSAILLYLGLIFGLPLLAAWGLPKLFDWVRRGT